MEIDNGLFAFAAIVGLLAAGVLTWSLGWPWWAALLLAVPVGLVVVIALFVLFVLAWMASGSH